MTRNEHGFTADTDVIITIAIDCFYHEAKAINSFNFESNLQCIQLT